MDASKIESSAENGAVGTDDDKGAAGVSEVEDRGETSDVRRIVGVGVRRRIVAV